MVNIPVVWQQGSQVHHYRGILSDELSTFFAIIHLVSMDHDFLAYCQWLQNDKRDRQCTNIIAGGFGVSAVLTVDFLQISALRVYFWNALGKRQAWGGNVGDNPFFCLTQWTGICPDLNQKIWGKKVADHATVEMKRCPMTRDQETKADIMALTEWRCWWDSGYMWLWMSLLRWVLRRDCRTERRWDSVPVSPGMSIPLHTREGIAGGLVWLHGGDHLPVGVA